MQNLKYLFRCQFNDGEIFYQTQEDTSKSRPGGSAFTDVLQKVKDGKVISAFYLSGDDSFYGVDLSDGGFYFDGNKIFLHEQTIDDSKKLSDFRLIYFRRRTQRLNIVEVDGEKIATPDGEETIYLLGWQANYLDGSNHKQIIYIG